MCASLKEILVYQQVLQLPASVTDGILASKSVIHTIRNYHTAGT
jgi:hypothetical protein